MKDDGSQYSSCSSCWSSGASSWACWSTSCPSPSPSSALSYKGTCSMITHKDKTGAHTFYWCTLLQKLGQVQKNPPKKKNKNKKTTLNPVQISPGSQTDPDWPVRLRHKGPPLAAQQTGHFLHPVPGTAAPPLAVCWSSNPSPSPPLPVPTLMCSPTKIKWFLASISNRQYSVDFGNSHRLRDEHSQDNLKKQTQLCIKLWPV